MEPYFSSLAFCQSVLICHELQSFFKMLFKLEEFENASFAFRLCGFRSVRVKYLDEMVQMSAPQSP